MTDDTRTMDLPLALRTRNALIKADLTTWKTVKAANLLDVPGLGAKGFDAIQALWTAEEQADVDDIATQVEMSQVEPTTPEESIAKGQKRQEVVGMIDTAMRGGLDSLVKTRNSFELDGYETAERATRWTDGRMVDLVEEIKARSVDFRARGGSIDASSGSDASKLLVLRLEEDIQARIRALIPTIKGLPHVKELGVDVDEKVIARMALIRGLESLEKTNGQPAAVKTVKAEPSKEDAPVVPTMQDAERYDTPDGWNKMAPTEAVPASQVDVHSYYAAYGWERYWGKVDSTTFYFYWCPEKLNQDVAPFPNNDKGGRKIAIQQTPWGPGHILPAGWNT